ncbi:MAG: LOG family protein [Planctomycetaceae bacterium]|nr:LOG family protein [Planctomycetaceae bacterium]
MDPDYIRREDLRPLRLELELLKPEMLLEEKGIRSTVVVFGGTQIKEGKEAADLLAKAEAALAENPDDAEAARKVEVAKNYVAKSRYYDECREFSRIVSEYAQTIPAGEFIIKTGGGPGIMEAANRGAFDVGAPSIGLSILLPFEELPNSYVTPGMAFQFNYFAIRKMHFLLRAKALICFPGGFGTLDEFFTAITLRQTERMQSVPIILYGKDYWKSILNFQFLADEGVIQDRHLKLFTYADSPEECWQQIVDFYDLETE